MIYSNVFYIPKIKKISGITTWIIELSKKYKDYDITIVYEDTTSNRERIKQLKQYVRVLRLKDNIINCKKLFITYGCKYLDRFNPEETIGIVHTDYKMNNLKPYTNVDKVIAVSNKVANSYEEISGTKPIVCYNPLTLEEHTRVLRLISATRMTDEKGTKRMIKLAKELDNNNIPYLWIILSEVSLQYSSDNIIYLKPRTNIRDLISMSDYLVQLSNDDESYSYSINESLTMGIPIISTKLSVLEELGIKDKEHGYLLPFDMSEIPIKEIYENIPKVNYNPPEDIYNKLIDKTKSTYEKEKDVKVRCIRQYKDMDYNELIVVNKVYEVDKERAEELVKKGYVEYEDIEPNPECKYSVSVIIPVWNQQNLITRTLDSIPVRNNVEIIVVDDKSTDNTYKVLLDYKKEHKDKNIRLLHNIVNKGVGYTYNRGLDEATGDYIVRIDSDDYFYPGQFNRIVDQYLDGTDMIYYNLEDNTGRILEVNKGNRRGRCGAVKFIRREFIGNNRCPEIRTAEDKAFNDALLEKQPTEIFTNRVVYHYNYPRENSLTDLTKRGIL